MVMARYAFELSGEHQTLPRSEALALLDIYSSRYEEVCFMDQCLIVDARGLNIQALESRLAMTHRIIEVQDVCDADLSAISKAAGSMSVPDGRYRIRAKRIKQAPTPADQVERCIGGALFRRGLRADLLDPDTELRAILTGDKAVLGIEVARIDRSSFEERRPHLKPFFHPGVLMPRIARALVNLSQVRTGEVILDPFSGTGGILVEACLAGISSLGVDVQKMLVRGARSNLGCLDCTLAAGDAMRLPLKSASVDGIVSDTPYGRSALIRAQSRDDLLDGSLIEMRRVLKAGRRLVIVADRTIDDHISGAGFEVIGRHVDRVHRSLTRHISICV